MTLASSGKQWLGIATRPSAAITEVSPISSGTPAATSEPKVIVRMISVIGSESIPAFARSSVIVSLIALLALAPPNCSITRSGCSAWTAAIAARVGSTRSLASVESPAISKFTSAAWPSAETSRRRRRAATCTFSTYWTVEIRPVTSSTAAWNSGSSSVSVSLCTQHDLLDRPQAGVVERLLGVVRLAGELVDAR